MFANIPEVKLGIIAVSRGCFPMALSERRRAAIKAAYGEGLYECPVTVENELDARRAVEDVQAAGVNALVVFLGNFGPETPETLIAEWFSGPIMYAAAAEGDGDLHDGRGDAYCGMLNCSYNLGLRGKTAYIPEYPVGTAPELAEKVAEFVPIARAILGLRGLKLITFGPRPDDFLACNGPIKALYDLGVAVEENSELDLLVAYNKHADDPRIPAKMAEMQAELGGVRYAIRSDYRDVLELLRWLNGQADPALDQSERWYVAMRLFYPEFAALPQSLWPDATQFLTEFLAALVVDNTAGGFKLDPVALLLSHQAAAKGGFVRNTAENGVGFLAADDLIGLFVFLAHFADGHAAAHGDRAAGRHVFENDGVFDQVLDLGDLGIELALLGLRFIVFAVLRQITERTSLLDLLGDFFFPNRLKIFQLFFQLFQTLLAHSVTAFNGHSLNFLSILTCSQIPHRITPCGNLSCYYTESGVPCQDGTLVPSL